MGAAALVAGLAGRRAPGLRAAAGDGGDAGAQPARARGRRLAAPSRRCSPSRCWPGAPRGLVRRGLPRGLAEAAALTAAATLATAPLLAVHFARPRSSRCRPTSWPRPRWRRSCGWGSLSRWASSAPAWPRRSSAWPPSRSASWSGSRTPRRLPGARRAFPPPSGRRLRSAALAVLVPRAGAVAAGGWRAASSSRFARPARARGVARSPPVAALAALLSRASAAGPAPPAGPRSRFLDIGQGDATLVQRRAARSSSTPARPTGRS